MEPVWHILRVRSGREVAVAIESSAPAYVPHIAYRFYDRRRRAMITKKRPMLPTYVFLRVAEPRSLRFRPGLGHLGFMRNGDKTYSVLSEKAFEALRQVEDSYELPLGPLSWAPQIGQLVQIDNPAYGEIRALVQEIHGDRVHAIVPGTSYRVSALVKDTQAA